MTFVGYVTRQTKVADVSKWLEDYSSDWGTVWYAENFYGYYKTKLNGKTKYFKGEMAESDIERMFADAGDYGCRL